MKKVSVLFIILIIMFALSVNAENINVGPDEYTVREGDTLWDISVDKLDDNFLWPKLWRFNPQIKNPDLIYPGDLVRIPTKEQLMRMMHRAETPGMDTPTTPVAVIPQKAPLKYMIDKNRSIALGWIGADYPGIGEIMQSPSGRNIFGDPIDTVYIKSDEDIAEGDRLFVIRKVKTVRHPITGKKLGLLIRVAGILDVIGREDNHIKANVTTVFEEVLAGDGVIPFRDIDPPIAPDNPRTPDISGYIVASYADHVMTARDDIIYLDKGSNDDLVLGDTFSVFSNESISAKVGTLQIVSLKPETSAALIIESSQEIMMGYMWENR